MNKSVLVLLFMFIKITGDAQSNIYEISEINKDVKISLTDIIGHWYSTDSNVSEICFKNINNHYVEIEGIKHGVGNYYFKIYGDSILIKGTAPNWPPYDCTLRILKTNLLEIEFSQFYSTNTTKVIYRR